jgi:hypothetical protein
MIIANNLVHDNYLYGIDPHTGSHDITIIGNKVYDNNASGIICSKHCYNQTTEVNYVPFDSNYYYNIVSNMAKNNYISETINLTTIKMQSIKNATSIQQVDEDNKTLLVENFL